jgi:aminoglycoside 6'-N-acetyltransferase
VPAVLLRPMTTADLALVEGWLGRPHVARWWTEDPQQELAGYRRCISGAEPTAALVVMVDGRPVGWCQWYRWADYPESAQYGAGERDIGIDYAIGEPEQVGRGVGTAMIAVLLAAIRERHPDAAALVAVDPANAASRRVLEKNGFALAELRAIESEPEDVSALYRRDPV